MVRRAPSKRPALPRVKPRLSRAGLDHRSGRPRLQVGPQADRLGAPHPSAARPIRNMRRRSCLRDRAALGCGAPSGRDHDQGPRVPANIQIFRPRAPIKD